ncbi:MAG TPA: amino acid adenylation domain-containing protein, partial [Mycobacteriales bacterium]|nr:amino acid adenylation domain-containing protein [Mycobacteriales bacterium]
MVTGRRKEVVIVAGRNVYPHDVEDSVQAALAGHLHESGLTGSRALLVHPPGPDFVVALFACFHAGVTAVPVVPPESRYRAARARVETITAACTPAVQLTSAASGPALAPERLAVLETDRVPAGDAGFTPLDVGPESTAILQFTSGATRAPRGVVLSHRSVLANLDLMDERYERRRGVVTVNWLPLHHDMGLFGGLLRSVYAVGHCVLMPPGAMLRKPIRWWRAVVEHEATVTGGPDFGFDLSVRRTTAEERDALDLSRLSVVFTGAEPVRAATLERFAAAFAGAGFDPRVFLPVYGLAEATLMVSGTRVPDPPRVLTVSADRLADCPEGERWLRTGDLGCLLDGEVVVTGRRKEVVIVAGRNVYPHDVEDSVQAALAGLRTGTGAAFGMPGDDGGERLVVVQEVRLGPDADPGTVADRVRAGVAADGGVAVSRVVLVAPGQVPKTSSGKVQRGRCRDLLRAGELKVLHDDALSAPEVPAGALSAPEVPAGALSAPEAPAGARAGAAVATELRELVADVLVVPAASVAPDRALTALGLDSLRAAELQERMQRRWGVEVDVVELLAGLTPTDLGALVAAGGSARPDTAPAAAPAGAAGDPFPLTDLQQAYLAGRTAGFELGGVGTHAYLEFGRRGLDPARAGAALHRLAERHDMMRAVILPDGTQRVLPALSGSPLAVDDLRSDPDPAGSLNRTRARMSRQVHDPYRGPVFEVRLSLLPDAEVRLHLSFDLLILDARSILQVLTEWGQLYAGVELPPVTGPSFRDFVLARRDREGRDRAARRAELRRRAAELQPGPGLPLAVDPATIGQPRFGRHSARLDRELLARLRAAARAEGVTLAALLGAAFAEVLALHSERRPFTLTLTSFERPAVDVGRQVTGEFTSLLLVGVEAAAATFADRVRGFAAALLREMAGRDINGVALLREHARTHAGGGPPRPVAPVVFTSLLEDAAVLDWLGEQEYAISQTPQVWLDHQVMVHRGELVLLWDAVEDLFPAGFLDAMFGAYQELLRAVADRDRWARPGRELAGLPAAPAPVRVVEPAGPLDELVVRRLRDRPDAEAVVAADRRLTGAELDTASRQVAAALAGAGVAPADLVAVALPKGWQQVPAVLGTLRAGAAYVPVDPEAPPARLAELIADSGARAVLTATGVPLPAGVPALPVDELWSGPDRAPELPDRSPADLAYVIYTSGSTGRPKGVAVEHGAAANTVTDVNDRYGVGPGDRALGLSPLTFDLSVYDLFGLLAAGGGLVLPDPARRAEPAHWAQLLRDERVTVWNSVPALLRLLHQDRAGDLEWARHLRLLLLSGDWIPVDFAATLRRELPAARLVSLGGATEGAIWSVAYDVDEVDPAWDSIPYGRAMRGQQACVLDADWGPRPVWVPGPLFLAGAGLAREYWRDPERTAASFVVSPVTGQRLYRTGDVARLRPDGTLELLGREDDQLKIQGHRVEPGEVEAALVTHPAVREAVVGGVGPRDGVRRLVAAVRVDGPVSGAEVRAHVARTLPRYLVPDVVRVVDALPLTANGKVDRAALLDGSGDAGPAAPVRAAATPRSQQVERELLRLVGEVSGSAEVTASTRLFDLELSSVHLIRLATELERAFGARPSLEQLYRLADLGELVDFYAAAPEAAAPEAAAREAAAPGAAAPGAAAPGA